MSAAERVYRLLLRAYPPDFRAAYGREMTLLFRDRRRYSGARGARFWVELLWDVARSAPALRADALRARWDRIIQAEEREMRPMAILALLIGAFEAVSAVVEGWAGGVMNHDLYSLMDGVLGTVAGALLVATGVALLRRAPRAAAWAQGAALVCLVLFVVVALVKSRMSVAFTVLGVGFPIVLLLFLRWSRGRSTPTMA